MNDDRARHPELEHLIAQVLDRGTWLASGIITVGLLSSLVGWPSMGIVIGGIALLIALPVIRVLLMLIVFVRERDHYFGAIALLVLTIIVLSALLGVHMAGRMSGQVAWTCPTADMKAPLLIVRRSAARRWPPDQCRDAPSTLLRRP
jgi:uncharacterized membrane protein